MTCELIDIIDSDGYMSFNLIFNIKNPQCIIAYIVDEMICHLPLPTLSFDEEK